MIKSLFLVVFLSALLLVSNEAHAEDIARCGASSGYEYYANRGLTKEKDVGWIKSGISKGKFSLSRNDRGELDILILDASGSIFSTVNDGAKVYKIGLSDETVTVTAIYPKLVETYVFQKLKNGKAQAMWTDLKTETPFPKVSAFISDCDYLNLSALKM